MNQRACLFVLCLIFGTSSAELYEEVAPVVWQSTDRIVDESIIEYSTVLEVSNPCDSVLLRKGIQFSTAFSPHAIEFYEIKKWCNLLFDTKVVGELNLLIKNETSVASRPKRQILIAGFVLGYFASNAVETVRHWINQGEDREDVFKANEQITKEKFEAMQKEIIINNELTKELASSATRLDEKIRTMETIALKNRASFEQVIVAAETLSAYFNRYSRLVTKLRQSIRRNKIDQDSLEGLTDETWLLSVDEDSLKPVATEKLADNRYRIDFWAYKKAEALTVYRIDSFQIWSNLSEKPVLMEYKGPEYLVHDKQTKCTKSIPPPIEHSIIVTCPSADHQDKALMQWSAVKQPVKIDDMLPSQHIEKWPHIYVYCYPRKITINNVTMDCPTKVMKILLSTHFNTTDFTHRPLKIKTNFRHDIDFKMLEKIHVPEDFVNHLNVTFLNNKIKQMVKRLDEADKATVAELAKPYISSASDYFSSNYMRTIYGILGAVLVFFIRYTFQRCCGSCCEKPQTPKPRYSRRFQI